MRGLSGRRSERQGGGGIRALRPASRATTAQRDRFLIKTQPLGSTARATATGTCAPGRHHHPAATMRGAHRTPRTASSPNSVPLGRRFGRAGAGSIRGRPGGGIEGLGLDEETAGAARSSTASVARRTHARAACRAPTFARNPTRSEASSKIRAQLPDLGEQDDVEHLPQVADAAGAAGAALEADHALDRRHVAEAPEPEHVLEVGQLLAELVQVPVRFRVAVDDEPGLLDAFVRHVGLPTSRARPGPAGTGRPRRASRRSASS